MRYWSMLVIGFLGAMWTMLAFAKSPSKKPSDFAGQRLTRPEGPMQCESILAFAKSPGKKPGEFAGHRLTRPEGPVQCESIQDFVKSPGKKPGDFARHRLHWTFRSSQCESMLVIVWPSDTYARWSGAYLRQCCFYRCISFTYNTTLIFVESKLHFLCEYVLAFVVIVNLFAIYGNLGCKYVG